jgi:replicative DNA helicase
MQRILQQDKRATVYSLEMSNNEIIKRLLSNWTDLPTQQLSREENQSMIAERAEPKADILKKAMFYDKIFDFNSLERSIRRGAIVQ